MQWFRVSRASMANAVQDFAATYTVRTWAFGWLGRIVAQVVFYTLVGRLIGAADQERYLLVGASVMAIVTEVMLTCASSTWERRAGTLPLLVAAPTSLLPVFAGRSVQWLVSSVATSSVSLFAIGPLFGVTWTVSRAVAAAVVLVVCAVGTYCMALALAALVLSVMELRNLVGNLATALTTAVCGAVVPVGFWPRWVQAVAVALPVTHGLRAVRALVAGPAYLAALRDSALALAVAAVWLAVADGLFRWLSERGRRDGSIEFADN
ncbi:MAG TPA: ABC transporter permease [Pseudonocardiaceae bacterium]